MSGRAQQSRVSRTRSISLQPELDDFVQLLVSSGYFANYSEVVRGALREFRRVEEERRLRLEANPKFMSSLRQARAGKVRSQDLRTIVKKS